MGFGDNFVAPMMMINFTSLMPTQKTTMRDDGDDDNDNDDDDNDGDDEGDDDVDESVDDVDESDEDVDESDDDADERMEEYEKSGFHEDDVDDNEESDDDLKRCEICDDAAVWRRYKKAATETQNHNSLLTLSEEAAL